MALAEYDAFGYLCVRNGGMEDPTVEAADGPLLFAVRYLIREYRNCIASLQFMLGENRDLFVPLPNDHPVALGIPLPHSLLAPHRQFCDAVLYVLQLLRLRVLWKLWKPGQMILREPSAMLCDKLGECYSIAATLLTCQMQRSLETW